MSRIKCPVASPVVSSATSITTWWGNVFDLIMARTDLRLSQRFLFLAATATYELSVSARQVTRPRITKRELRVLSIDRRNQEFDSAAEINQITRHLIRPQTSTFTHQTSLVVTKNWDRGLQ
jgi:hypothetical protein